MKKSVKVSILGRQYPLKVNEEDEELMVKIASYVDTRIRNFKRDLSSQNETTILVLSCLSIAEELFSKKTEDSESEEALSSLNDSLKNFLTEIKTTK